MHKRAHARIRSSGCWSGFFHRQAALPDHRRIIGIAFCAATIKACRLRLVEWRILPEAFNEVGICNDQLPETNRVSVPCVECLLTGLACEFFVHYIRPAECSL